MTNTETVVPPVHDPLGDFEQVLARWQTPDGNEPLDPEHCQEVAVEVVTALGILPEEAFDTNYERQRAAKQGISDTEFMMGEGAAHHWLCSFAWICPGG